MSSNPSSPRCAIPLSITPTTSKLKRTRSAASLTNFQSAKRRRVSLATGDLLGQDHVQTQLPRYEQVSDSVADRFISARPKHIVPLHSSPRSNRMARVFGLADARVLNFSEPRVPAKETEILQILRKSASDLLRVPKVTHHTSAASHLGVRKAFVMALDGPGVPLDLFASPLAWSTKNYIAVACDNNVYYQCLSTREIVHLCEINQADYGIPEVISWGGVTNSFTLALGTTQGVVQLWNAEGKGMERSWSGGSFGAVGSLDWYEDVLAVGRADGTISLLDSRVGERFNHITGHRGKVIGAKWSTDGKFLASSDYNGGVYIWDARACKHLTEITKKRPKMKNGGPTKALAWCPWRPDLLATGSTFPDGRIRIWSTKSTVSPPVPLHTLSLNTSVTSLVWSPHCKELLSTHGHAFVPGQTRMRPAESPLSHSLTVHSFPDLKRIVSVPVHPRPVGQSCLSPDGTNVFTLCPDEGTMKMWKVWGSRDVLKRSDSVFDKCTIR